MKLYGVQFEGGILLHHIYNGRRIPRIFTVKKDAQSSAKLFRGKVVYLKLEVVNPPKR